MENLKIFRQRYIPFEIVDISNDEILFKDDNLIITKWNTIRPKIEFAKGVSYAFLNEGYKISRIYDESNNFLFWYCDIIEIMHNKEDNAYTFIDLILDIKILPDGKFFVLDCDELAHAIENKIIPEKQACTSLKITDKLLKNLYQNKFPPDICKNKIYHLD